MTNKKEVAQAVKDAYENSYTESGLVAALREVVYQLQYYNFGACGEDVILDARAVLDVAEELENIKE